MAASANPSGNNNQDAAAATTTQKVQSSSATANGIPVNSNSNGSNNNNRNNPAAETAQSLRHNPGLNYDWTPEEQSTLEDLLTKYASDSNIVRYAKIAMELKDKTVRDVALRCRWMTKKENGKRRKEDHSARKNKDRKEKATDSSAKSSSHLTARPNGPYPPPMIPVDNDDGISYEAIGGVTGDLLKQNAQFLNQISANFNAYQFHDNINLLSKTRDNILTILNDLNDMPEIMKQMPPLPVKLNQELANSILSPQRPIN